MRIVLCLVVAVSVFTLTCSQVDTDSECKLQDLAIDAALGDPHGQYNLGVEFHRGDTIPQDFSKAARMWRLASEGGIIEAYNNLGFLTYNGKGVKQDYAEGARLWRVAAEKGFVESQVHLGYAYIDGKSLQTDYGEAYAWGRTAEHFAGQSNNDEMLQRARRLIKTSEEHMSNVQKLQAEKMAAEYMIKYKPE